MHWKNIGVCGTPYTVPTDVPLMSTYTCSSVPLMSLWATNDSSASLIALGLLGLAMFSSVDVFDGRHTALIAATAMHPGDYFAINTTPAVFAHLGMPTVNLADLAAQVRENVTARTGGAVSLAVGMATPRPGSATTR